MLKNMGKKYSQFYAENFCLSKPMDHNGRKKNILIQTTGGTTVTYHIPYTYKEKEKLRTYKTFADPGAGDRTPSENHKRYKVSYQYWSGSYEKL